MAKHTPLQPHQKYPPITIAPRTPKLMISPVAVGFRAAGCLAEKTLRSSSAGGCDLPGKVVSVRTGRRCGTGSRPYWLLRSDGGQFRVDRLNMRGEIGEA